MPPVHRRRKTELDRGGGSSRPAARRPIGHGLAPPPIVADEQALPHAAVLFLVALVTYALTLYRTVPGGDSGELVLVAQTLGVAHPPGYPLFTLLGKVFTLLPLGTVAWRVNLLSAVCDAGAAAILLLATARWTGMPWAGVLAGGLFAFSPLTWSSATGAEVFALNNLFCAGLLWLLVRYHQGPDGRIAMFGAFWCGLAMTNHHLFALFALPAMASVLWRGRTTLLHPRPLAVLLGCFGLGLLPYLYLPIASARLPEFGWGDQTTLDGFLAHVSRRDYGTFDLAGGTAAGASTFAQRGAAFLGHVPSELCGWGVPLGLFGAWTAVRVRSSRAIPITIAAMLITYLGVFLGRANLPLTYPLQHGIQARFWLQANLLLFFGCGVGLWALGTFLARRLENLARFAVPAAAILGASLPLALHYREQDHHATTSVRDFARAVLETLPPNALLVSSGDYLTHSIGYLQRNDRIRPDVRVVDHVLLQQPWEARRVRKYLAGVSLPGARLAPAPGASGFDLLHFMDANVGRFPLFIANGVRIADDSYRQRYNSWPIGLVQWMVPNTREIDFDDWMRRDARALARFTPPAPGRDPEESWEHETLRQYWYSRYVLGVELINDAARHANDRRAVERAVQTLEAVRAAGVFVQPDLYKNLGGAYWVLSASDPRARDPMKRYFTRYLELVPDASDREDIRSMMKP